MPVLKLSFLGFWSTLKRSFTNVLLTTFLKVLPPRNDLISWLKKIHEVHKKTFVNWNFQQQNIHVVSHSPIEFAQELKKFFLQKKNIIFTCHFCRIRVIWAQLFEYSNNLNIRDNIISYNFILTFIAGVVILIMHQVHVPIHKIYKLCS